MRVLLPTLLFFPLIQYYLNHFQGDDVVGFFLDLALLLYLLQQFLICVDVVLVEINKGLVCKELLFLLSNMLLELSDALHRCHHHLDLGFVGDAIQVDCILSKFDTTLDSFEEGFNWFFRIPKLTKLFVNLRNLCYRYFIISCLYILNDLQYC